MRLPLLVLASSVLIAMAFAACGDDDEDVDESGDDAASDTVQLVAADFEFTPTELVFAAGEETQITFTNTGQAKHNFTVDGTDVDEDVDANGEVIFDFTAPDQDAEFHCEYHPDTMTGTIVIEDAATSATDAGGASASEDASPEATDDDDDEDDDDNSGSGSGEDDDDDDDESPSSTEDDDGGSAGGGYGF